MAGLSLRHIYKVYRAKEKQKKRGKKGDGRRSGDFLAVKDFNMEIEDGEFIVFVGPSGCGKSTTLRMIAGLEDITAGDMYIGDRLVNDVEPKDRDIAMVFQNYALYPHMTAAARPRKARWTKTAIPCLPSTPKRYASSRTGSRRSRPICVTPTRTTPSSCSSAS